MEIFTKTKKKEIKLKSQQHPVFPGGLPSKYYPGPTLLNFSDRTRTGAFNMVWPLAGFNQYYFLMLISRFLKTSFEIITRYHFLTLFVTNLKKRNEKETKK